MIFVFAGLFIPKIFGQDLLSEGTVSDLGSKIFGQDIDAAADKLSFVGDNIVAEGHVSIKYEAIWVTADKAVINLSNKDVEATGRVKFVQRKRRKTEIPYEEYLKLLEKPDVKVIRNGYVMTPTGKQLVDVTLVEEIHSWTGDRAVGNLTTGIFDLGKFAGHYDAFFVSGKHAERTPKGEIRIKDAKLTTCEYVKDNHEHYSVTATSISVWPWDEDQSQNMRYMKDADHYSLIAYNTVLRVFDIPIFYFPVMYKPAWDSGFGISTRMGSNTDWGYFLQLKKTFKLPSVVDGFSNKVSLFGDYYSKRGFGGGVGAQSLSQNTKTDFFMYGIHDRGVKPRRGRMKFDEGRYDLWVSHINHITPRLDFRGRFEMLSDVDFLHDFFRTREDIDPQPATYGALEYQFDRLSVGAYVRPKVNRFFSVVEKLPEVRIDVPRQELFKNIYYQGEMSFNYMKMNWRHFNYPRAKGGPDPKDYESFRFDSLNMLYYPFKISEINLIPRAGIRFTAYSRSSDTKIDQQQIENYVKVDAPYTDNPGTIVNYDSKGGSKFRVVAEFGLEANTKIQQSWMNAKSAFWEIDGFRHVMVPYLNYNFIPTPTVSRDRLYYFDDIDRIEKQHFIRIGIKNRLQTRRGAYGAQEIYDWASIEHYMDFHFHSFDDTTVGDFGTVVNFQPFSNLSAKADLLFNMGKGTLSRFSPTLEYQINEDWRVFGGYYYQNTYTQRAAYSMGSSITDITSGTAFERSYSRNHSIFGGLEFPIIDDKTKGMGQINYNFEQAMLDEAKIGITRSLHCWEVGFEYRIRQRNDDIGDMMWEHAFMFTLGLTAYPSFKVSAKQEVGGAND